MVMPAAAAVVSATWICAAVTGWAVSISQPPSGRCSDAELVDGVLGKHDVRRRGARGKCPDLLDQWVLQDTGIRAQRIDRDAARRERCCGGCTLLHQVRSMPEMLEKPGRLVRMSAFGLTSDGLIPNARRSCGVATERALPPKASKGGDGWTR